jgi:hypothetical protein
MSSAPHQEFAVNAAVSDIPVLATIDWAILKIHRKPILIAAIWTLLFWLSRPA